MVSILTIEAVIREAEKEKVINKQTCWTSFKNWFKPRILLNPTQRG